MTKSKLEKIVEEKNITSLKGLQEATDLSKYQITNEICSEENKYLKQKYGNSTKLLTLYEAVDELDSVTDTELRKRKARGMGEGPRFFQKVENSKIYYPLQEIACEMYLEKYPIFYNEVSLSKIIKTRHD